MLADNSGGGTGASINLVLWGEEAETFSHQDKIVAIKKAQLKEFNGVKNLAYPRGGSMELSPLCPQLPDLELWVTGMREACELVTPVMGPLSGSAPGGPVATIQEIKDAMAEDRAEKKFTITGYPIKVRGLYQGKLEGGRNCLWFRKDMELLCVHRTSSLQTAQPIQSKDSYGVDPLLPLLAVTEFCLNNISL